MKKCNLCGRKISDERYSFGLGCLKKVCSYVEIKNVKNLKAENKLNSKVQKINSKILLNKKQKQLLTNRYLTYQMLNEVEIPYYQRMAKNVYNDIEKINNKTNENNIKTYNNIKLKEVFEILKLYGRYKKLFNKTENYDDEQLKNEIQNLPWDTVMFAFSSYYNKKTYLSELIQVVQLFIWKIGVRLSSNIFECGSEFLNHSLQENPEDLYITEGKIIEKIKEDNNFESKIDEIVNKYKMKSTFDTKNEESLNYIDKDLFLALNNTDIRVIGNKNNNKWDLDITITDTYDFTDFKEVREYLGENIFTSSLGSLLNNAAMLSTAYNVINEYGITIKFSIEKEIK